MGDEALIAVAQGCSLHNLNVSGCVQIGDAGVIAIARGCPQLCYLDVSVLQVCTRVLSALNFSPFSLVLVVLLFVYFLFDR